MGKQSEIHSNQLASLVLEAVERQLEINEKRGWYRSPLVGFAAADDQLFKTLRIVANPDHL
ncbi:MAG: hypothetical protein GX825_08650 [Syntrophomonadaceae bacterium]|nr:hypothetical protein [Syntrophomonadaceae bacterium]